MLSLADQMLEKKTTYTSSPFFGILEEKEFFYPRTFTHTCLEITWTSLLCVD